MITLAAADTLRGKAANAAAVSYLVSLMEVGALSETYKNVSGQLPSSTTTLYTAPFQALVREILFTETSGVDQAVSLYVNGTAAANRIAQFTVVANGMAILTADGIRTYDPNGKALTSATITLTGDVTGSGSGTVPTTIQPNVVDNTKAAQMAQSTMKGRAAAAGTGNQQDMTPTQIKTLLAIANTDVSGLGALATVSNLTGDVTSVGAATTIPAHTIDNSRAAQMAQATLKGRTAGAGTGDQQDLAPAAAKTILAIVPGDVTGFDTQVRTSRLDQMSAPTAAVGFNAQIIQNVADAVAATDGMNLRSVQALISGLSDLPSVNLATAGALPANTYANGTAGVGATLTGTVFGALSVDGQVVQVGWRILVQNEANTTHNGLYVVSAIGAVGADYVLTRATDCDSSNEFRTGALVPVEGAIGFDGATNDDKVFVMVAPSPFTVGTSGATFTLIASTYSASTGLQLNGTAFSVVFGTGSGQVAQGNDTRIVNAVQTTRNIVAGAGLTGGGDMSVDRTLNVVAGDTTIVVNADEVHANTGTAAGSVAAGNEPRIVNAVQTSRQVIAGAGMTGGGALSSDVTVNAIANADGSIVVNADDIQVGVISSAQHGNQTASSLHAVATTTLAGFMKATDKKKLDGLVYDLRSDGGAAGDSAAGGGGTNDATSIQNSINTVGAAGGGIIWLGRAKYRTNSQLTCPYDCVTFLGAGSGFSIDVGGNEVDASASAIIWGGTANTVSMLKVDRSSGGAAVHSITGFRFIGIALDTVSGTTTKTLEMISCHGFHVEDFFFIGGTFAMSCRPKFSEDAVNGIGDAPDCTRGKITRGNIRNIDGSGAANACVTMDGNTAGSANTCCNLIENLQLMHGAGGGIILTNADTNTFVACLAQQTGSGVGIDLKGSAVSAVFTARNNVFINCSAGAGSLIARGGTFPSLYNYAICHQTANPTDVRPTQEPGAILIWNENAPQSGSPFDVAQADVTLRNTASVTIAGTGVADITGLAWPVQPGEKWQFEAQISGAMTSATASATGSGLCLLVDGPAGLVVEASVIGAVSTGGFKGSRIAAQATKSGGFIQATALTAPVRIAGVVVANATQTATGTGANVRIQVSNTGTATAQTSTVLANGFVNAHRVSL